MSDYFAPQNDMNFVLKHVADLEKVLTLPEFEDFDTELATGILEESAKFCSEVLAPLNKVGDEQSCQYEDGVVTTPPGWKSAYDTFIESGWNGLAFNPDYGGQGLPWLLATAVQEMWHSANMSFGLCPLLTQGAIRALENHASPEQQDIYMENMISGVWAGTMNLTEAHAGSDLSVIRTRAVSQDDHYLISGQKVFITYGEHDLTENIIHFVLGRATDSPAGVKGISLFIVPKFLVNSDGSIGERNDVRCVSIEHKLGIKASPTAVMSYGENGGAVGYLVGEKNRGLEYMFTMMNLARHAVGVEGLAIAERAYQQARDYATQRVQGTVHAGTDRTTIINHPDVRRMLLTMKASIEAMRSVAYYTSAIFDMASREQDAVKRQQKDSDLGILIPIVKGWCAELGNEVTYLGVQVHGGMGYIEETGAAQHFRDARITPIYEGTTGIQANDLIGRKLLRDKGTGMRTFLADMRAELADMTPSDAEKQVHEAVTSGISELESVTDWALETGATDPRLCQASSVGFLMALGYLTGGFLMAKSTNAAVNMLGTDGVDETFLNSKILTAQFYATHLMPRLHAHAQGVRNSSDVVMQLAEEQF